VPYPHFSTECDEYHGLVRDFGGTVQDKQGRRWGGPRPEIVVLCGSTRFYELFQQENYRLTMEGFIVLSVGFFAHAADRAHGQTVGITPEQKVALDDLHMRKIDLADRVFVIDPGGYIGDSTRSEIEYAEQLGRPIEYLSARHAAVHPSAMADATP
jgi:hypothetical protein